MYSKCGGDSMKTTTVRMQLELNKQLEEYAKQNDLSKNQVVKLALRELFKKQKKNN